MSCRFYLKITLKILQPSSMITQPWRLSEENYHSNEINTCLSPNLKSAYSVYDREERFTTSHLKKPYTHVATERFVSLLTTLSIFASHSVCTTEAWGTTRRGEKFVDEVRSTVFHKNSCKVFATSLTITKANSPFNFTIFHCRMSTIQPAWQACTTSV